MLTKMTITGIEAYYNLSNKSIFDNIRIPELLDKSILKDAILYTCGEFGAVYTDPVYLNARICAFFDKNYDVFEKWVDALALEYNPIYNYDRYEDLSGEREETTKGKTTNKREIDREVKTEGSEDRQTDDDTDITVTDQKAVVNDSNLHPYDESKSVTDGTVIDDFDYSSTVTEDTSDDITSDVDNKVTGSESHTNHIYGNIGVTESTTMVKNYILTKKALNPYNCISDMFVSEFCIMVY